MVGKSVGLLASVALASTLFVAQARADVNLALGKSTTASSQTYGASSLAVDGNIDTNWFDGTVFQSNNDAVPFWMVDLGADYSLKQVNIYQRTDYPGTLLNNFGVTVFDTLGSVEYTNNFATSPGQTVSTPFDVVFSSPVTGRYVQIVLGQQNYLALAEVQVMGNAVSDSDVPEPASALLLLGGALGAAGLRRTARKVVKSEMAVS